MWKGFEGLFNQPTFVEKLSQYLSPEAAILEMGCGYGRVLWELQSIGFDNLVGVDASLWMLQRAKREYPHLEASMTLAQGEQLGFRDNTFEVVVLVGVLTCIPERDQQRKLIKEIIRVLKPEGLICIGDFLISELPLHVERYCDYAKKDGSQNFGVFQFNETTRFRHHSFSYLKALLSDFELLWQNKREILSPMSGQPDQVINLLGRLVN